MRLLKGSYCALLFCDRSVSDKNLKNNPILFVKQKSVILVQTDSLDQDQL